jgi:hypothetical protein
MAVVSAETEEIALSDDRVFVTTWTGIASGDTCEAVRRGAVRDRCVQVTGTFGAATIAIQGSNDSENYAALKDTLGNALSFTSAGIKQVLEIPLYIKPTISGSGGTGLTIVMVQRRGFR